MNNEFYFYIFDVIIIIVVLVLVLVVVAVVVLVDVVVVVLVDDVLVAVIAAIVAVIVAVVVFSGGYYAGNPPKTTIQRFYNTFPSAFPAYMYDGISSAYYAGKSSDVFYTTEQEPNGQTQKTGHGEGQQKAAQRTDTGKRARERPTGSSPADGHREQSTGEANRQQPSGRTHGTEHGRDQQAAAQLACINSPPLERLHLLMNEQEPNGQTQKTGQGEGQQTAAQRTDTGNRARERPTGSSPADGHKEQSTEEANRQQPSLLASLVPTPGEPLVPCLSPSKLSESGYFSNDFDPRHPPSLGGIAIGGFPTSPSLRLVFKRVMALTCMGDPNVDHGFYYDVQGRVDVLHSPFFDVAFGNDTTADEYVERVLYQLTLAIEDQLPANRWCLVSRRPSSLNPATSPTTSTRGIPLLLVASLLSEVVSKSMIQLGSSDSDCGFSRSLMSSIMVEQNSARHSKLEGRKGRRVKAEPEVLALAECGNDGLSDESRFKLRWGDAVNDFGVVSDDRASNLLAGAVLLYRPPRRLYFRELRHLSVSFDFDCRAC
ncbi:hypothetical protein M5K25_026922 [Dendrobium thyrsiflorum]|uniref:Uncharacterized protein n=1 Tax=Dendrobium thyrsiflorum TaxID=117978 RepID=A0ABD0TYQ4_DENTH